MLLIATLYDALVILSKPHLKGESNRERYEETYRWFFSKNEEPFSYLWICIHLRLNPRRLQKEILSGKFSQKERRRRRTRRQNIT